MGAGIVRFDGCGSLGVARAATRAEGSAALLRAELAISVRVELLEKLLMTGFVRGAKSFQFIVAQLAVVIDIEPSDGHEAVAWAHPALIAETGATPTGAASITRALAAQPGAAAIAGTKPLPTASHAGSGAIPRLSSAQARPIGTALFACRSTFVF